MYVRLPSWKIRVLIGQIYMLSRYSNSVTRSVVSTFARQCQTCSLQIISPTFFFDLVKLWLAAEPASHRCPDCLIGESGFLFSNLARLASPSGCCGVRHQLGMAALLKAEKPEYSRFDSLADSQQPVVLQERGFLAS